MVIYLPITTKYTFVFLNTLFVPFTFILKLTNEDNCKSVCQ